MLRVLLIILALVAVFCLYSQKAHAFNVESASLEGYVAIPHNEPDVFILRRGNEVSRYLIRADIETRIYKNVYSSLEISLWGAQEWRSSSRIGNGLSALTKSNYSVKHWVPEFTYGLEYRFTKRMYVKYEQQKGSRIPYYHIVGVGWKFR